MKNTISVLTLTCLVGSLAQAQTYTAVELSGGYISNSVSNGAAAGQAGVGASARATLWNSEGVATDLHPSFLSSTSGPGWSTISGQSGGLCVGSGAGQITQNRPAAIRWQDSVATLLADPFTKYASYAYSTDGAQIVGNAYPFDTFRDIVVPGDSHAIIWDAQTGEVAADLYDGNPVVAYGVAAGQQVGYEIRGSAEARLWFGDRRGFVNLHPARFDSSIAAATDGVHQVGYIGARVKIFAETRRGFRALLKYGAVWSGTAESLATLAYGARGYPLASSYANGVAGDFISGYGEAKDRSARTQFTHAVTWVGPDHDMVDLHNYLPEGYVYSRGTAVDASGNVSGYAVDATNHAHAMLWVRNP
ncbi:MAG: hypothetical protein K8R88_10190 [Armatimonadetes bacterium]|nr:hypothetical protein [Armatimonadota bacterium]